MDDDLVYRLEKYRQTIVFGEVKDNAVLYNNIFEALITILKELQELRKTNELRTN